MSGPSLHIRLLGKLQVELNGSVQRLPPSRKARALLGYLVATEREHSRQALCDLLWDGVSDPRGELRWCLSKVRPLVDEDGACRLVSSRGSVRFESRGAAVDLRAIRSAMGNGPASMPLEALEQLARRFTGELLEGLELDELHGYHAWCLGERQRVRRIRAAVLAELVQRLREDPGRALTYAYGWLALEPFSETANAAAVRLLGALGRTQDAIEHYQQSRSLLRRELGVPHSRALEVARQEIGRAAASPRAAPRAIASGWRARGAGERASSLESLPPLIGRDHEVSVLEQVLDDAARSRGSPLLLIGGEQGIGKTRLLEELLRRAEASAGRALHGLAFEVEGARPYGPWIDALRDLRPEEIPPELHAYLAVILPELGARSPWPGERGQLFDAVLQLLRKLARERPPLVLALDDLQWLDESSCALLHYVARTRAEAPLILACAVRLPLADLGGTPARLLRALRRESAAREVRLERLDSADTAALVRAVEPGVDAAEVARGSQGNPFFALEIARSLRDGRRGLPASLEDQLVARLESLSERAREVVSWAAVLGRSFRAELIVELGERIAEDALPALEELRGAGILRVTSSEAWDFSHDLLRQVVYGRIPPPSRRMAHLRLARALDRLRGSGVLATSSEVASHALAGGDVDLAVRASAAAAEECVSVLAFREAAELARQGIEHLDSVDASKRRSLHLRLLRLFLHPGMPGHRPDALENDVRRLTEQARASADYEDARAGYQLLATLHYQRGDFDTAREYTLEVEAAGREADPATAARALGDTASCLALLERDLDRADELAQRAERLARRAGVEVLEIPLALGLLQQHHGQLAEAGRSFRTALDIIRRDNDPWWNCPCLSRLAMIELELGNGEEALRWAREAEGVAEPMREAGEAAFAGALARLAELLPLDRPPAGDPELDEGLSRLRRADSKWMLAWVQTLAAELDLVRDSPEAARGRAEEALHCAEAVGRPSLVTHARALFVRAATVLGDGDAAAPHHEILAAAAGGEAPLSASARAAALHVLQESHADSNAFIHAPDHASRAH